MADLSGRCACGAVSWTSPGPILWAGHCHCASCRRACSAPFTSFFGVPRDSVVWTGQMTERVTSDGKVTRKHCPACGSQMTYQFAGWPDETHLYAATLDDPTRFVPEAHYHFAERVPWIEVADTLPRYPGSADTTDPIPQEVR